MAIVTILPAGRRTCEESIAFRATVSPPHLRRKLPRPALPATYLRQLIAQFNTPRLAYRTAAEKDLASGDAKRIARGIYWLEWEMARYKRDQDRLHQDFPLLYPEAA